MAAKFYLRGTDAQFVKALPDVGWRSVYEKAFFQTRTSGGATRVLELMDASQSALPLESESKRVAFKSLMSALRHPFLYDPETDICEYFRDKDMLVVSNAVAKVIFFKLINLEMISHVKKNIF